MSTNRENQRYSLLIISVITLVVLLICGTIALMVLSSIDEKNNQKQEFKLSTVTFILGLENVLHQWRRRLLQLRTTVELSYLSTTAGCKQPLSFRQWELYLNGLHGGDPDDTNVFTGWTSKVELEHRAEYEAYLSELYGNENLTISDILEDRTIQEAGIRDVYFPFGLLWPWRDGRSFIVDLASERTRKATLELAFHKDAVAVSEPITFITESRGIYLLAPAFDLLMFPAMDVRNVSHACPKNSVNPLLCDALLGFVTLLFNVQSAVQEAAELSLVNTFVRVTDLDTNEVLTECHVCERFSSDLKVSQVINVSNRQWQIDMHLCEAHEYAYSNFKWLIVAVAVLLSVMTILSMLLLKTKAGKAIAAQRAHRRAEAQREAEERSRLFAEEERIEAAAAQERAECLSKAKTRFLNDMNRELRTPLSGVVGTIDILQNNLPKEILKMHSEDFNTIANCAEILLSTVNDILDMNKLMAGKLKLHYSFFYIRDAVKSCLSTVRVAAKEKNIHMTLKSPKLLKVIMSDQARLSQIILNFLSNAVKFTPKEGKISIALAWGKIEEHPRSRVPSVGDVGMSKLDLLKIQETWKSQRQAEMERHGVESHGEQMILCVEDSGIGIAEDKIGNLFQPFEQADASVTRAYGGTGLGLSICRQLAELLGGSVWVESTIGVGSKFYLSLPVDVVGEGHVEKIYWDKEGFGKKQLKMICSLSEKTLKLKRSDIFEMCEVQVLTPAITTNPCYVDEEESMRLDVEFQKMKGGAKKTSEKNARPSNGVENPKAKVYSRDEERGKQILARQFSGKKILIVEDNLLNQKVFIKYLENAGVDVTVASNGHLGVEAAMKRKFDLIFMDCHMPVMDGYLASQHITEDEKCVNKSTPIIALTADVEASNKRKCEESGMVGYLTKPLQSKTLYDTMRKHLQIAE